MKFCNVDQYKVGSGSISLDPGCRDLTKDSESTQTAHTELGEIQKTPIPTPTRTLTTTPAPTLTSTPPTPSPLDPVFNSIIYCQAQVRSPKVQSPKVKTKGTWADTIIT